MVDCPHDFERNSVFVHQYTCTQCGLTISEADFETVNSQVKRVPDVYILIQEGGSSKELYIHSHMTSEEAEADRISCAEDGSYRTSPIICLPGILANEQFYECAEKILTNKEVDIPAPFLEMPEFMENIGRLFMALRNLDYPETAVGTKL